jgi:acyl-CoA thioesterase-2
VTDSSPERSPQFLTDSLVSLLTVEPSDGDGGFAGRSQPGGVGRVFGGQVVAQALQAAQACAPDGFEAHSLHAYFLRAGVEGSALSYDVAADFTGRSFANRRVIASQQHDDTSKPILNFTASFQRPQDGLEHQDAAMPEVAPPEDLRPDSEMRAEMAEKLGDRLSEAQRSLMLRPRPIEIRTSDRLHWMNSESREPHSHSWFRTVGELPAIEDDAALHRAVIAYASDFTLLGTCVLPHGLSWMRGELVGASLDHAIWFHRPARADEWLLYVTDSPWSGGSRGFNRGRIFNREGQLVASVAQEGMVRRRED